MLDILREAARDLASLKYPFAVIGGIAVGARTTPRTTTDVHLCVAVATDQEAEGVVADLTARGYILTLALEQTDTGRLSLVRLRSPIDGETYVDLLFASSGIEDLAAADADGVDVGGVEVPVAALGHLVALKVLSNSARRAHKDAVDLDVLLSGIDDAEFARARAGVRLIMERGSARGRNLVTELEQHLAGRS